MNRSIALVLVAAAMLAADGAVAQVPGDQDWKIGPYIAGQRLRESDVVTIPLRYHHSQPSPPWAGWAGYKYTVHVLDNTEVDVDAVINHPFDATGAQNMPIVSPNPFGPRSDNVQSQPREWKRVHPFAQNSGIDVPVSHEYRIADLELHIKGTNNPAKNSDTDVVVRLWNIWHYRFGSTSQIIELRPSDRVWVGSPIQNIEQLHRPDSIYELPPTIAPPLSSPDGHWLHVQQPIPFHFYGSQFYATLARTITIGIEHVPEPTAVALSGLGLACAVMGLRSRWKRRAA